MQMTRTQAKDTLIEAGDLNPGPWVRHSMLTGLAAQRIASADGSLDPDRAFVLGLLHDIGRRFGRSDLRHTIDGYKYLRTLGYESYAGVCLSHSFPTRNIDTYSGRFDVGGEDLATIRRFVKEAEYSDYDRLIQLCDHLAQAEGYCVVEKRMIDVAMRYGVRDIHRERWAAILKIRSDFDDRLAKPVYALLPGISYGTFGTENLPRITSSDPEYSIIGNPAL